jgi:hypothetical protein
MITSREIRELLELNPDLLYYIISSVLDASAVPGRTKDRPRAWLDFEYATDEPNRWSWDACHETYINWKKDVPVTAHHRHSYFRHPHPVPYTRRLIKYAFKLGYFTEASHCAAALRELKLWEPPFENHVSVRR